MRTLTRFFSKTPSPTPEQVPDSHSTGEMSEAGGPETPAAEDTPPIGADRETITEDADGGTEGITTTRGAALAEKPPADDVCPICFGSFDVPCRSNCGHWYCGSCILQYWNFGAALQPCKCPMCSQRITKLIPEASLYHQHEVEVSKVLQNVGDYNRLFVGGISGLMLRFVASPMYIKRMFREMLNPDRPGIRLNEMRIIALLLGILYSYIPFDFLGIGRRNIIDVFDYAAFALSFILYLVGLYIRRRRLRNVRELAHIHAGHD